MKRPNLRVFHQKDANGIANNEDPDQTAPLGGSASLFSHMQNVDFLMARLK